MADKIRVLALDVSGACTGWAYGVDGKLVSYGKNVQKKNGSRGKRLAQFANWLSDLLKAKKPTVVLIEKPYRGRNSNVLVSISKYIAVVEMCAFIVLNLELEDSWFLDPRSIKKALKVNKGRNYEDNKRLMTHKINELFGLRLKYNETKGKNYNEDDTADAIALLAAWWTKVDD